MNIPIPHREGSVGTTCRSLWLGVLAVVFVLVCAVPGMAQLSGKGAITGTVADKTGAVIANATITATNTATGLSQVAKSTGAGDYHFSNLDPGIYTVTTTAQGFKKLMQENIHVNALESQAYNPVLQVGAADVQITVTAAPPQLETTNATLGATMEQETYSALPIEMGAFGQPDQRRATDFAYLMPGVQGNETNGNATTNTGVVNGSGSRGAVSDVYVDGIPFVRAGGNGDPRYVWSAISVDAIDQFQVQTTGYPAMYEGQGVMNYSIKHGGSQLHGSVYEFFRNTALDTWGYFRPQDLTTYLPYKPVEHMNEYGIALGGPLIPFGKMKEKLFFFTNYNGFRYTSQNPTPLRFPSNNERAGDFTHDINSSTSLAYPIYDPSTQTTCTANSTSGTCRYQYGYSAGTSKGSKGNPVLTGTANVIPSSQFSTVVKNMQSFLPSISSDTTGNNYTSPNNTGLINWSTTSRIDYVISSRDNMSVIGAVGRQASSFPAGQTTSGRNTGPVPYNWGQAYAPKTAVWAIEETHTFSPNLINQLKWGYARYNGPTFDPDDNPTYAASTMGLSNLPTGQAQDQFPIVTFSGNTAPTGWHGTNENVTIAANYTLLDNIQWNVGKHSFTFGGQTAWLLYNVVTSTKGSSPITLTGAVGETAGFNGSTTAVSGTGQPYASFLIGQIDKGSFSSYLQQEFGARFRAISPWVQDDWKITSKLTLNLGLRYDFYPSVTEVHNAQGFFNPSLANTVTGLNGALQFTGTGTNTCNCSTPVNNYYKNWGPRLGLAYQLDSKTVVRASYGVMYSHGGAVGGLNTSLGTLGFASSPSFSSSSNYTAMTGLLAGGSGAVPSWTTASGAASGTTYGTGYTTVSGYTGSPSSTQYDDPYFGGRAPEFLNWNLSIQRQVTNAMALTLAYVGSEGHFLQLDSNHARGYWANDLDPKYLYLGARLADTGSTTNTVTADCTNYSLSCPGLSIFSKSQALSTLLKPYPFQSVSDSFGYVGNANYNAMQAILNMRSWHGLNFNASYVWARTIDDGGTFRTGYQIPAGTIANHASDSWPADRMERSVSTSSQPHHFVATAVWDWPLGKTIFASNAMERAILGGFKWSGIFQAYSGSPLAITENTCQTNPAQSTCTAVMNPNFTGKARINGKWGKGTYGTTYFYGNSTATSSSQPVYIASSTDATTSGTTGPFMNTSITAIGTAYAYKMSDAPRTAPYNLYGPGYYQLDMAVVRSFPLHFTESAKLDFRAEWYDVTNNTQFSVASSAIGASTFAQATNSSTLIRKSAQFSARISF